MVAAAMENHLIAVVRMVSLNIPGEEGAGKPGQKAITQA